jgi:hypothetical protein
MPEFNVPVRMYFCLFTDAGKQAMSDAVDVLLHYCEEMFRKINITKPAAEENNMIEWSDTESESDEHLPGQHIRHSALKPIPKALPD